MSIVCGGVQAAVACGYTVITHTVQNHTISITSTPADLRECYGASSAAPGVSAGDSAFCVRCPTLLPDTLYTLHAVASSGPLGLPGALSTPLNLTVRTAASAAPPALLSAPFATDVATDSFTLRYAADRDGGGVAYAVTYAHLSVPFFAEQSLRFPAAALAPADVVAHARGARAAEAAGAGYAAEGVVAAGMQFAGAGGVMASVAVAPRCSAAACAVLENRAGSMLAPATEYVVWAVALGQGGSGADGGPALNGTQGMDPVDGMEGAAESVVLEVRLLVSCCV